MRSALQEQTSVHYCRFGASFSNTVAHEIKNLFESFKRALARLAGKHHHVLILDELVPDPLFGAGYPRAHAILRALTGICRSVDVYVMASTENDLHRMNGLFPRSVSFLASNGEDGLKRLLEDNAAAYSFIFISRPVPMQAFLASWRPPEGSRPRIIYDFEAVISPREAQRRRLYGPAWSEAQYTSALKAETDLARGADLLAATSKGDALLINSTLDLPVRVLSYPVCLASNDASFDARKDFLFVGRLTGPPSVSPNVDSILWFVERVMPIVDARIGCEWVLHVVGVVASDQLDAIASDRVVLHGAVEDLSRFYATCRIFIAPTRYAAGIPIKVIEAMGRGLPCVVTSVVAKQFAASGDAVAAGSSPVEFAECCNKLYTDPAAWKDAKARGIALVKQNFSQRAFRRAVKQLLT